MRLLIFIVLIFGVCIDLKKNQCYEKECHHAVWFLIAVWVTGL